MKKSKVMAVGVIGLYVMLYVGAFIAAYVSHDWRFAAFGILFSAVPLLADR